jgi:hypothetical protein
MAELGPHLVPSINFFIPLRRDTDERLRLAFWSYPGYQQYPALLLRLSLLETRCPALPKKSLVLQPKVFKTSPSSYASLGKGK